MTIKLKDSTDIFDIWKMARKYNCDDFHNMLKHKLINTKAKPITLAISEDVITDSKELVENESVSFSRLVGILTIEEKEEM